MAIFKGFYGYFEKFYNLFTKRFFHKNDIKLQYLYIIRDNIEYYITKKNKYIFTLLDNKVSLIPTSDDKNKTLWLIQTNNICDFSTSEILLSYFKKTITDLIQGRIETFDDKEIPTLSHINPPLLEGARIATEDDLQKVRFKTEPKAIEKTEQYNVNGSFSNKNETNYIFYTTKHKYIFTISRINGDKLLEPQNRMANTMFNEIIEAREIFPSLAKLLLILILAIVHPQISLLGFILLFILADIILYTHFFRKITFLFKNIIYLGVTKHFVFFSRFLLLDKIISSIIILYRFKYNYIIVSYLILSVLLHFLYFIRKGNPAYDCQDAIPNNSLAEYSIIKYGNK